MWLDDRQRSNGVGMCRLRIGALKLLSLPKTRLRPGVPMMEAAENFDRGDLSDALNGSMKRRVLVQRQMNPRNAAIGHVCEIAFNHQS